MIRGGIKKILPISFVVFMIPAVLYGQDEREYIRKGNKLYRKSEFSGSEVMYRRAQGQEKSTPDAGFNLGDALYKQGKFSESSGEFDKAVTGYNEPGQQAEGFYNLGNALLKEQKYKESIEAYISSLKLEPDNMAAKYNLAFAQDQMKKQEEQQQQQQQDQKQNENKPDENQNKENENKQQDQEQQYQNGSDQPQGVMSREDAKRLLDALATSEKNTQEKVLREKATKAKVRVIKNW